MEEFVLKDYESFDEFPEKKLLVDKRSNAFYIKKQNEIFIARQNIDSLTLEGYGDKIAIKYKKSYYNIKNGEFILSLTSLESIKDRKEYMLNLEDDCKIVSLNSVLDIKDEEKSYYSIEDIDIITKSEKVYKKV